jgi:hypothetical protein
MESCLLFKGCKYGELQIVTFCLQIITSNVKAKFVSAHYIKVYGGQ